MGIVRTDIVAGHAPIPIGVIRTVMVMIAAMGTVRVMLGGVAIDVMSYRLGRDPILSASNPERSFQRPVHRVIQPAYVSGHSVGFRVWNNPGETLTGRERIVVRGGIA
jgi:hypothetical protein